MGSKLLFVFGIVVAHGALAAGWMAQETPTSRNAVLSTCARQLPTKPLHIAPARELLAQVTLHPGPDHGLLRP